MKQKRFDRSILITSLTLVSWGLVAIYSASFIFALTRQGDPNYFLWRQLLYLIVGIALLYFSTTFPLHILKKKSIIIGIYAFEIVLLILVFFFPKVNGSHRWIKLFGFSLQPSEFAKLVTILLSAYIISKRLGRETDWTRVFIEISMVLGPLLFLIFFEPDFGMCILIGGIVGAMIFVAGAPLKKLIAISIPIILIGAILLVSAPYRVKRLQSNSEGDPQNTSFQVRQSLIAVGNGGAFGKSIGGGIQKRLFLPLPHTDFIFANIAEEVGFVGSIFLILLYIYLAFKGYKVSLKVDDPYYSLIAIGITSWIIFQALIHIGVNLYLLPPKGVPLPLISYGGSSLLSTFCGIGLLLNISREIV